MISEILGALFFLALMGFASVLLVWLCAPSAIRLAWEFLRGG